jgi:hypothetical protein
MCFSTASEYQNKQPKNLGDSMMAKRKIKIRCGMLIAATSLSVSAAFTRPAQAYEYQFNDGVTVQFINTLQYSVLERTSPESSYLQDSPNANDGDNNLRAGIVSNRFDLLTKLDVSYQNFGFDASADSFYDTVYNQKTQNDGSLTYNAASDPSDKFTSATQTQAGRNIELRNLFVYDTQDIAGVPVTLRVGRLVNLFGESLFFANNGIAYGTAPIDILRATSVPNTQAKDLFLPSGQALVTIQPTETLTVTAYYQFEWEKYNFVPAGSYFSTVDLLDEGGQRLIAVPSRQIFPGVDTPGLYFYRGKDEDGRGTGQMGIAVHYDPPSASYDLGLYALQYNDSEAQVYVHPNAGPPGFIPGTPNALVLGTYNAVYGEGVKIYGVSGSTTYGPVNFAGEVSARTNEPLVSSVTVPPGGYANGTNATLYAKGDTLHYQASAIYLGTATPLWEGCSWLTEVAADNLLGFTENRQNFATTQRHMALGLRTLFTANYFHVLPALDIAVPIGLGYNFMGLAPDTQGFNTTGIDRGGDLTVGLSGTYRNVWTGGISYTRYIAPAQRDPYADRDFFQFNVERSF